MVSDRITFLPFVPDNTEQISYPLYYRQKYLNQIDSRVLSFSAVNKSTSKVLMVIHFQMLNEHAMSLDQAPFGGIHMLVPLTTQDISAFLHFIVNELKSIGAKKITLKNAPNVYLENNPFDQALLKNVGFINETTEINHHLTITKHNLVERFSPMQKRRFNKCIQANILFKKESPGQLESVYHFICECRKEKGHSVSISYDKLKKLTELLPDSYLIFSCYDGTSLIAASICVVVNPKVLYNFLPSSKTSHNAYSPMVFLTANMYNYCRENGFSILDLGTSMRGPQTNDGLATFKSRIGGIRTQRSICQLQT